MKKVPLSLLLLLLLPLGLGASDNDPAAVPEPPTPPPQVESGEVLEPEVTIIESDKGTVEQYSVRGRIYMVKITPVVGPAYYLLDNDGDGTMDVREDHPTKIAVPQWVLFSW